MKKELGHQKKKRSESLEVDVVPGNVALGAIAAADLGPVRIGFLQHGQALSLLDFNLTLIRGVKVVERHGCLLIRRGC